MRLVFFVFFLIMASMSHAGADLVQIYTGFIYEGPSLVKKINTELINTIT